MNPFLICLALAGLCLGASAGAVSADNFLIVPGKSIGQTALGPNGTMELKRLPTAAAVDSGMQQTNLVWVSHRAGHMDTLSIHGTNNGVYDNVNPKDGMTLDQIRVTSRQFHTRNGLSTASTLAQVRQLFPDARSVGSDRGAPGLYEDSRRGIAFEFAVPVAPASRCIGISVFKPSSDPSDTAVTAQIQVDSLLKDSRVR